MKKSLDDSQSQIKGTLNSIGSVSRAKYAAPVVKIPSPQCVYQTRHSARIFISKISPIFCCQNPSAHALGINHSPPIRFLHRAIRLDSR